MGTGLSVTAAAQHAEIGRSTVYKWRKDDENFAKLMDEAYEQGVDELEDHALRRAHDAEKPSDALTMFLLKAHRPSRYRERVDLKHSGELHQIKRIVMEGHDPELIENLEGKLALESDELERDRDQEPDDR